MNPKIYLIAFVIVALAGCMTSIPESYHDPEMEFSALRTIAVMPFSNLTGDKQAAERVRNTFMTSLMATGVVYVIPSGEVIRGIRRAGLEYPMVPSIEDVVKLAAIIRADAVITGVLKEYGEVRSGTTTANVISLSMQMIERETRKVVWTAATTKGGINAFDRLFGGGGKPMNDVTEAAVNDILKKLIY
jgi:hypothetical protein